MESTEIIKTRQRKLDKAIKEENLNALVLNPGPSLTYFTGLHFHLSERPVVVFFRPGQNLSIVLPELEAAKANHLSYPVSVFPYAEDPDTWIEAFKGAAQAAKPELKLIGVEPRGLRFLELRLLEDAIPQASFFPSDDLIASLRMFKDDREATYMQQAVDIAQNALKATLPYIVVGRTEAEIATELSLQLMRHGSNPGLPFFPIVSSGPNSANPHAAPSDRPLTQGDLLVIDYGANVNGYYSDITRTFAIGEVDPECYKVAEIVLEANKAGRDAVKAGVTAASVDSATRGVIKDAGYGSYFIHRTGHGLGLEVHEDPYIRDDNDQVLQVGMAFTVEPGIYIPDRFGVRVEDNVVVTLDGVNCLTSLPRELVRLPIGK